MTQPIVNITDSFKIFKDKVNQISTNLGDPALLGTDNQLVLVDAINEIETIIRGGVSNYTLDTISDTIIAAINEHETELYVSGSSFTGLSGVSFTAAIEELRVELGDHTLLATDVTTDAVSAINELESAIRGNLLNYTLATTATNIVDAINEHEDDLYTSTTGSFDGLTSKHFKGVVEEIVDELGQVTGLATTSKVAVGAINENHAQLDSASSELETTKTRLTATNFKIGKDSDDADWNTLNTGAQTIIGALNEHESDIGTMALSTTASNLTAAINEHESDIGTMVLNTDATNITSAINELQEEVDDNALEIMYLDWRLDSAEALIGLDPGVPTFLSIDTTAQTLVGAINELNQTDIDLQTAIDNEALTRANADSDLQVNIDIESARLDGHDAELLNINDNIIGDMNSLVGYYDSADSDTLVGALNLLAARFINVYDENGILIN